MKKAKRKSTTRPRRRGAHLRIPEIRRTERIATRWDSIMDADTFARLHAGASELLKTISEQADYVGFHPQTGRAYLLVWLAPEQFEHLCTFGSATEDMEQNGDLEDQSEDEGAQCDDDGVDDDSEVSAGIDTGEDCNWSEHSGPASPIEFPAPHPVTGEPGKWVMLPKEGAR